MPPPQVCYNGVRILDAPCLPNVRRLDLGALPMIEEYHRNGITLDIPVLDNLAAKLRGLEEETRDKIRAEIGRVINWNSGDQVADLLFHELNLKPPGQIRYTEGGRETTDDEMLSSVKDQHPVVGHISDGRGFTKIRTTYAEKLGKMVWPDGRLHTTFKYTRAETGRLTSEDPNLQNIPIRTELGNEVRNAFMAGRGVNGRRRILASLDFSQIEMVFAGDLSGDRTILDAFRQNKDIHTQTAVQAFRLDPRYYALADKAKAEEAGAVSEWLEGEKAAWKHFKQNYRLPAKTVGFGILYGQTALGAQSNIQVNGGPFWPLEEVETFIRNWFKIYYGIAEWMELQYSRARRHGMVWDCFGRIRRIPEARSRVPRIISAGLRQAGNMPIQSSAQGLIKLAMAQGMELVEYFRAAYTDCCCLPLLQIHDELIFELDEEIAEEFCSLMQAIMEGTARLLAPVRSSHELAERWGALKG